MRILMLLLVATLAACANWPQNPQEFRERAKNGPHQDLVENIDVSRPLAEVSAALHKQSAACLNQKVTLKMMMSNVNGRGGYTGGGIVRNAGTATYKSTFASGGSKVEVAVQRKVEGTKEIEVGTVPEGGAYRVVADATALSANRTRLDIYRMFYNDHTDEAIRDAFIHWAKGDSLGCPVLDR